MLKQNKTQRTINLINSKMGTLQISAKQDTETSLYLVGSNTVGEITAARPLKSSSTAPARPPARRS